MAKPREKPGFRQMQSGQEVELRLTKVQGDELALCSIHPQRRSEKPSWTWRQLLQHELVTSEPHYSERLQRNTASVIYTITDKGQLYLKMGRDR